MKKSLIALAIPTFCLGIAEFGMMGFLDDVARGLDIDVVKAGRLISAYSLGVAVGSPGLILLRRWPMKRLLLLLVAMMFVGNICAALSPSYLVLLASRFVAGLPHGAFFGAGAIVAERLAPRGKQAMAVAVMIGGMTVANVVGVPLATFLANALDWRLAFAVVALGSLVSFFGIKVWVPWLEPLPDSGIKRQFDFLRKPGPWLIYAGVFFGQASVYCWLSYISPIMTEVARFPQAAMSWIMVLVGLGMVVGNALTGKLSDRYPAALVTGVTTALLLVIMPAVYFLAPFKVPSVLLAFVAPACLFGLGGPLQYLIVRYAKGGEMLGGAGIQIAFNVSNAVSASLGGAAINLGLGLASPALVGIPFAAVGAAALFLLYRRYPVPAA
ncbi:MAG: MFS transporter [Muribaculaceae bacterium]|nr:MFS transporter [Muribaculaceae bacterium]MDE7141554.1 MFS transporter [Muribaculaceae bacterium]